MAPNLLEQKEFFRSVGKAHKPLGSYDLARIEPAEKGLKGLPLHRHRKSPRHAAIAGVQMRGGQRLLIVHRIDAHLGWGPAKEVADVWQTEGEPDALSAGILFGDDGFQRIQLDWVEAIAFGEAQDVGELDLLAGQDPLSDVALGLGIPWGVHDADHGVQLGMLQQVGIREDIDDIVWVCQSAGFHDDVIAVTGLGQLSHGSVQLVLWRAAHTTATHLGHRQTRAVKNLAIDALGPELVHHHAHAQARGRGFPQPSQQQRGLARSQKTGD